MARYGTIWPDSAWFHKIPHDSTRFGTIRPWQDLRKNKYHNMRCFKHIGYVGGSTPLIILFGYEKINTIICDYLDVFQTYRVCRRFDPFNYFVVYEKINTILCDYLDVCQTYTVCRRFDPFNYFVRLRNNK